MATDTLQQAYETQLKNILSSTGKSLEEWRSILNQTGLQKHGELVNYLKEKHGLGHGNANSLVHYCKQSHAEGTEDKDALVDDQYKGKEELRAWYEKLKTFIEGLGDDVVFSAKKGYMSVRRKKQFAILQPSTKTRFDIGLNIKNLPPAGRLEAAGSWNAMCTHRIKIESESQLDETVFESLRQAYDQAG